MTTRLIEAGRRPVLFANCYIGRNSNSQPSVCNTTALPTALCIPEQQFSWPVQTGNVFYDQLRFDKPQPRLNVVEQVHFAVNYLPCRLSFPERDVTRGINSQRAKHS